MRYYIQ